MIIPMAAAGVQVAAGAATVTLNESDQQDATNLSTYTLSIDAGAGGFVVLVFAGREGNGSNTVNLTSVTIDGNTASTLFSPCTTANNAWVGMAYVGGVSAGTVTAVVTLSDTAQECRWATYTISGLTSETPHDTGVTTSSGAGTSDTVTINIPADGVQIGVCQWSFSAAGGNVTWTNLTEDWDQGRSNLQMSSGSDDGMGSETGRVITATVSTSDEYGIIAASWA